jgi:hypothetical protein
MRYVYPECYLEVGFEVDCHYSKRNNSRDEESHSLRFPDLMKPPARAMTVDQDHFAI